MRDDAVDGACTEFDLAAKDLAAMGIELSPPRGSAISRNGWVIIGAIAILAADGIEVTPRKDLLCAQLDRLIAAALQVWLLGKDGLQQGWKWVPSRGWVALVGTRYPAVPSSSSSSGYNSSISAEDGVKPLVLSGFSVPSAR